MDFALTEQQELIRKEVAALSRNFSLDYWLEKDRKHEYPDEFVKAFGEGGWLGLMIPEAYGGAGLGVTEAASPMVTLRSFRSTVMVPAYGATSVTMSLLPGRTPPSQRK